MLTFSRRMLQILIFETSGKVPDWGQIRNVHSVIELVAGFVPYVLSKFWNHKRCYLTDLARQ